MPRYFEVPTVSFKNPTSGKNVAIKDIRPRPTYVDASTVDTKASEFLDEVASRTEVYGEDNENNSYKLYERNEAAIVDAGFQIKTLRSLVVPL